MGRYAFVRGEECIYSLTLYTDICLPACLGFERAVADEALPNHVVDDVQKRGMQRTASSPLFLAKPV